MKQQFAAKHPWTILAAGAAIQVLTGLPAAWGVFQQPVMEEYGLSEQGAGYAFALLIASFGVGCVLGGFLQDKKGPRCAALWGTALLCGGFFAAAFLPGWAGWGFFLAFSIPAGLGTAFLYPSIQSCAQKWYAGRKGLATGVIGGAVLMLVDLWTVDKRYLNDSNFIRQKPTEVYKETVADQEIMKDKDLSYRVLNLNNPFLETTTSYYHHSVGGYYAAKLRRYQELIDHRLQGELNSVIGAFQKAQTAEDLMGAFAACPSLNMLNTRYIIYNPEQPPLRNPFAFGNAWFVDKVEVVENADAEIAALNTINPLTTAVVDKRFANEVKGFTPQLDSTATITLDSYRPNKLVYTTKTNSEQLAVFSEIYYQPGWEATIDGKPAPHFRADWILRAMLVPAGEHQIVFEFRPQGYITAAYITSFSSLIILLLLIGAVGYSIWKARKQKEI